MTKEQKVMAGIWFNEDEEISFPNGENDERMDPIDRALDRIQKLVSDDPDAAKSMLHLLELYEGNNYFDLANLPRQVILRIGINQALLAVVGYSLPTLLGDDRIEGFDDEPETEEENAALGFAVKTALQEQGDLPPDEAN